MKDRKASLNLYSPCDWKAVERHLTRMAAKGWRLEYVGHACWHYRRAAPAAVHYAVTWLPGLSAYAPEPTVEEADLSDLCAAAGWQKVCGWGNMMIYANVQPDPVPLITDERLRLQNLHAAMKKGSLPGMGVVFGVSAALALLLWPVWAVSYRTAPDVTVLLAVCALGLPGIWLLNYWGWYRTARRAVEENRPCPVNRAAGWLELAWLAAALCLAGRYLYQEWFSDPRQFWYSLCFMAGLIGLGFLGDGVRRFLRENGSSKAGNIAAALVAALVCAVALVFVLQLLFPA